MTVKKFSQNSMTEIITLLGIRMRYPVRNHALVCTADFEVDYLIYDSKMLRWHLRDSGGPALTKTVFCPISPPGEE